MKKFFLSFAVVVLCLAVSSPAFADTQINSPTAGSTNTSPITFTGTGVENSTIELLEDNVQIATAEVDASGDWSLTTSNVTEGEHDYIARNVLNAPLAIMLPHNGPSIEFKNAKDFGGDLVITLPNTDMIGRAAVVRGSKFWVLASGADPADGCYVYAYESDNFTLLDTINMGSPCVGISLDVNTAGTFAVIGYQITSTSQAVVKRLDLSNQESTGHIEPSDTFNGGVQDVKISPDGQMVYVRYAQKLVRYNSSMAPVDEFDFFGTYYGNVEVSRDGNYVYLNLGEILFRRAANDLTSTSNVLPISGAALTNVAISPDGKTAISIGSNTGNIAYEFDLDTLTKTHTTTFEQFPESVSISSNGNYVVGDNHAGGVIYYGTLGSDAYTSTTVNNGASYYNQNSSFITNDDSHFITQSAAVTLTTEIPAPPTVVTFGNDTSNPITSTTRSPGQTLEVSGKNFLPDSQVTISLHSNPVVLKTLTTNSQGGFSTTVTVPADTTLGNHQIVVAGLDGDGNPITGTLNLLVAELPVTGANPISHFWLALQLILAGAVLAGGNSLTKRYIHC